MISAKLIALVNDFVEKKIEIDTNSQIIIILRYVFIHKWAIISGITLIHPIIEK